MALFIVDAYIGENPGALNNPPVNEVLLTAMNPETGEPMFPRQANIMVQLLKPTQLTFLVNQVDTDGIVTRIKLSVFEGTPVPVGLNVGCVRLTGLAGGGEWGCMCTINLSADIPQIPVRVSDDEFGGIG